MASPEFELLGAFEVHSVEEIRAILDSGFDVRAPVKGKSAINSLIEMYTRSVRFPDCLRLLLERGALLDDPLVASVLLDDAEALTTDLRGDPLLIVHRTSMVSAFTPLVGASLLHVAAEFGHVKTARVLLERGADVDARASFDDCGLNGHMPVFHTVNSNDGLLNAGATLDIRLDGMTWGKGFDWETTCVAIYFVSPVGLIPDRFVGIGHVDDAADRRVTRLAGVSEGR